MECRYYDKTETDSVRCNLCPHRCLITEGNRGLCSIRYNNQGLLISEVYGVTSSLSLDPVEKKPLYHYFPGMKILSVGSYGCNLTCSFCQNHDISQVNQLTGIRSSKTTTIEDIIKYSLSSVDNCGIAFTYNEPTVWIEFMQDIAMAAASVGQKTAMITNGYINPEPLDDLIPLIDAFNVDLKAFSNNFYRKYSGASLKPVLNTLLKIRSYGRHLEITMLIIESLNDNPKEFEDAVKWIADNLGRSTPLHLSRYFPRYRMSISPTSEETLINLYKIARERLDFVYLGNIPANRSGDTVCPSCGTIITLRSGYDTQHINIGKSGDCNVCGNIIYREFTCLQ